MADYYSILNKTISGLPKNSAETRLLVYEKARSTIERQLRSLNPPPSEQAVTAQLQALETAIGRLENEQSDATAEPVGQMGSVDQRPRDHLPSQAPPPESAKRAETSRMPPAFAPSASPERYPQRHPVAADDLPEEVFEADVDDIVDTEIDSTPAAGRRGRRSGGFGRAVLALLILAALVAGGYALWINREPLLAAADLEGLFERTSMPAVESEGETVPTEEMTEEEPAAVEKEEVRLGQNGETVEADEGADNLQTQLDTGQSNIATGEPSREDAEVSPVEEDSAPAMESTASESEEIPDSAPAGEEPVAVPAIGQKAYLYEEGLGNNAATRDNAAIVWSAEQEPPTEGAPAETVIKGQLEVPGRGVTMDLTIKRNVDESLSASHIIELMFDTPQDFSGGNIDTLARFVMKANEQARGEPLVAVPVKIDSGFFMIALNNLEQARESNRRLLLESDWIDIPLGYSTGRRALVTLEKGDTGDTVFREAFEDWDGR